MSRRRVEKRIEMVVSYVAKQHKTDNTVTRSDFATEFKTIGIFIISQCVFVYRRAYGKIGRLYCLRFKWK